MSFSIAKPARAHIATGVAFAATMTLAGFLLFQVQLVLGKFILPWFGGSASTWLVCMLFYQVALLAGYAYAYALTRPLAVRTQVQVQLAILLASLALLPIAPSDGWKPIDASDPTWRILGLLAVSVGLPYIALATTTPLLSRWLANIEPQLDPVRFFAASNIGSFLGLLTYPFLFERWLASVEQTRLWSWAYVAYAVLLAVCGWLTWRRSTGRDTEQTPVAAGANNDPLPQWVGYSALGSALLLATTNNITQWSAVVPFLWVVPLSCYLFTFVIVFAYPRTYHRAAYGSAFLLLAGSSFFLRVPDSSEWLLIQLGLHTAILFAGCMICHGELVKLQPEPVRLPKFYLAVAAGGAAAGVAVVLLAPLVFGDYFEHPLVLLVVAAVALLHAWPRGQMGWAGRIVAAVAVLAGVFFLAGLAVSLREEVAGTALVERVRNFYGVVKVVHQNHDGDPRNAEMALLQAGIDQGGQYQLAERRLETICGFNKGSPLDLAVSHHPKRRSGLPLRIGVIGLGVGMVASLAHEGDVLTYYEINPAVQYLSSRHFTFLKESKAKIDVLLGDARLVLERQLANDRQSFDILVLDAFRGASPPMHLMTKEAFAIYIGHLAENGVLAVNFELDTFEVAPLHRGMAKQVGLLVRWFETPEAADCLAPISWALYSRDKTFFATREVRRGISRWRDRANTELVWTDNDSNLMSIINWAW